MDSINSFIHLLDKIETQDRRLGMTIKNLRCLAGGKSMELAYAMALKLEKKKKKRIDEDFNSRKDGRKQ